MRSLLLILLFSIVFTSTVLCQMTVIGQLNYNLQAPPKTSNEHSLYAYLYVLYQRWMQLQITNLEPNGNITETVGSIILYNNSGTYYLAVETADPMGSTWKGVQLGAV